MHLPISAPTMRHECALTHGSHSSTAMRACATLSAMHGGLSAILHSR